MVGAEGLEPSTNGLKGGSRGRQTIARELAGLALGAAPALLALAWFKAGLVPTNDLVAQVSGDQLSDRAFDLGRYAEILHWFANMAWALGPVMVIGVLGYLVVCRSDRIVLPIAVVGLMLCGYFTVYLLTSHNLSWHLATSAQRLLLQLLPSFLFAVFSGTVRSESRSL